MSQRTPKICQPRGKIVIPIEDGECLYWLIPVDTKEDIENPTRDFAWLDKRGVLYVFDGSKIVPINDPDLLKVKFENVMGSPYDQGELGIELNKRVQTIKMNNSTVPMRTNGEVDLGCVTTCDDLERAIAGIETMHVEVVDELPAQGDKEVIYLVPQEYSGDILDCHEYEFVDGVVEFETPINVLNIGNGGKCNVIVGENIYPSIANVTETQTLLQFDNGVITSTLSPSGDDSYILKIEINGFSGTETVCVQSEEDTVYTMYVWYENAYRQVGDKRKMAVETKKDWQENDPNSAKYIENRTHYLKDSGTVVGLDKMYILDALQDSVKIKTGNVYTSSVVSVEPLTYTMDRYTFQIDPAIARKIVGVTEVALTQNNDEQLVMSDVLLWDIQNNGNIFVVVRNYTPRTTTQTKTITINVRFKYLDIE